MSDLVIRGLRKAYGDAVALDDVSIRLAEGEFVSLLGPSGCGKTTTLRSVAGFVAPDAGEIELGGAPLIGLPPHRRDIGVVFQSYALFPHMSVAGNVGFGLRMRDLPRAEVAARVSHALDLVGLGALSERYPSELSGGQQQRVALARALVIEPRVLLLDEPLSNLDARLRGEMRDEIKAVTDRTGVTTLFVTHDQAEALAMSDRVAVMREGRILEAAPPEELVERPRTPFAAQFLGGRTVLPGRAVVEGGAALFRLDAGPGLPLSPEAAGGVPTHAVLRAARLGLADAPGPGTGLPVTVERAVFLGDIRQVEVRAGAALIRVHLLTEAPAPRPGDALYLSVPDAALGFVRDGDVGGHPPEPAAPAPLPDRKGPDMTETPPTSPARRRFGRLALGGGALLAAPAILSRPARAQIAPGSRLVVGIWGGAQERITREFIAEPLMREHGVEIEYVLGGTVERRARAYSERGRPSFDVIYLNIFESRQAVRDGVTQAPREIAGWDDLYDLARIGGYGVAFNAVTPVYDRTMVEAPMTAWADFWREDLAGRIAWPSYPGAQGTSALLMAARINGGDEFDIDPGFEAIAELKPFAAFQSSQAQLYGMFDADQVAASAEFGSFTQKYADTQNPDIVVSKPSEGMPVAMNVACITEGTENQALAEAWVSLHLSEACQRAYAEEIYYGPTIRSLELPPEIAAKCVYGADDVANLIDFDWEHVIAQQAAWSSRFNREIQS
jgi:putative spermidine/putrescine transport system substrate-binding protein